MLRSSKLKCELQKKSEKAKITKKLEVENKDGREKRLLSLRNSSLLRKVERKDKSSLKSLVESQNQVAPK